MGLPLHTLPLSPHFFSNLPHLIPSTPGLFHSSLSVPISSIPSTSAPSTSPPPPPPAPLWLPTLLHGTVGHGWTGQMGILMGCWVLWGVHAPGGCSRCSAPVSPLLAGVELRK